MACNLPFFFPTFILWTVRHFLLSLETLYTCVCVCVCFTTLDVSMDAFVIHPKQIEMMKPNVKVEIIIFLGREYLGGGALS